MSTHQDIDALSRKADLFRAPPHALFAENARDVAPGLRLDNSQEQLLAAAAGNLKGLSDGYYKGQHEIRGDDMTPEEREEKKKREATTTAINTITNINHAIFMEGIDDYGDSLWREIAALDGRIAQTREELADTRDHIVETEEEVARIKAEIEAAKKKLETAEENADTAENRAQNAREYGVVYDAQNRPFVPALDENGNVLYYVTYDENGNQLRETNVTGATPEELARQAQDAHTAVADNQGIVDQKTSVLDIQNALLSALREQEALLEGVLGDLEGQRLSQTQKWETFKQDREAYINGGMTQEQFVEKYPQAAAHIAARNAYEQDLKAGILTAEELREKHAELFEKRAAMKELKKDRQALEKGEMSEEDYRAKYPKAAARLDEEARLKQMKEANTTLDRQIAHLGSDEVTAKLKSGETTLEQVVQDYGIDQAFYNDFAERHGDYGLKRIEVADASADSSWFAQVQQWVAPVVNTTTQVAEAVVNSVTAAASAPTPTPTATATPAATATALSSADGQGIRNDGVDLKGSFSTATTATANATPDTAPDADIAAPVIAASAQSYVRPAAAGYGLG